jgi:hypothetical protein
MSLVSATESTKWGESHEMESLNKAMLTSQSVPGNEEHFLRCVARSPMSQTWMSHWGAQAPKTRFVLKVP